MILCLFIWCLSVLLNHVPTLLVAIFCRAHYNFYSRVYNDHERICSQVVCEICSIHIYGFEQSELDIIIDSSYLILYVYFSHAPTLVCFMILYITFPAVSYLISWSSAILIRSTYHGYGRVRVFVDLTCVDNTLESGHYLYRCTDWSLPWLGRREVSYSILANTKMEEQPHQSSVKTEQPVCRAW